MRPRRRPSFWAVLVGTTAFMSVEPGLFLVVLALALSALALASIVLLVSTLLTTSLRAPQSTSGWLPPAGNTR